MKLKHRLVPVLVATLLLVTLLPGLLPPVVAQADVVSVPDATRRTN